MPSKVIPNATVKDVETALIDQYGRRNITERSLSNSSGKWEFKITSKSAGKCIAEDTPQGVRLTMSGTVGRVLLIFTIVTTFMLFGVLFWPFCLISRFVSGRVVSHRFPKMVDAVADAAAARGGRPASVPPLPR